MLVKNLKDGIYISKINNISRRTSATGKDFICVEFEITDEENENYKNTFMNNMFINTDFGEKLARNFLEDLECGVSIDINDNETFEEIKKATELMEFDVEQKTNGVFKSYSIKGIYDLVPIE